METFSYTVDVEAVETRLDRALTRKLPDHSRTYFKELISEDCVTVNGSVTSKPSCPIKSGDTITITFPPARPIESKPLPTTKDLGVKLLFEHEDFLIVFKPAGLVVHTPHPKSTEVTLVDWLVHSIKDLSSVGPEERPGIVHRLDKDTSGLLVIARNNKAHAYFASLFHDRKIEKVYLAFVKGHPEKSGLIDEPIGRHPIQRHKMAIRNDGKEAQTQYTVAQYYDEDTLLEVRPVTGRTHQIRVHCAAIRHAILGDATYGSIHKRIKRHALHAYQLSFTYKNRWYSFSYSMPKDMQILEQTLS